MYNIRFLDIVDFARMLNPGCLVNRAAKWKAERSFFSRGNCSVPQWKTCFYEVLSYPIPQLYLHDASAKARHIWSCRALLEFIRYT